MYFLGRVGDLELRFYNAENIDEKIANTTALVNQEIATLKAENFEMTSSMNSSMTQILGGQAEIQDTLNVTTKNMVELNLKVQDATSQSSALGDALAGTFQQYAMLSGQIYGLRSETDQKIREIGEKTDMLNSTLELVAMSVVDASKNNEALQEVFLIKGNLIIQDNSIKGKFDKMLTDQELYTTCIKYESNSLRRQKCKRYCFTSKHRRQR